MKIKNFLYLVLVFTLMLSIIPYQVFTRNQDKDPVNFIYLYGGSTDTYKKQLNHTYNQVQIVSPNYFNLDSNGDLLVDVDPAFVDFIHQQNMKIMPFVSNHFNRDLGIIAMKNRYRLADQIAKAVIEFNLDGVSIDIENLTENEKDHQTEFLQILSKKLHPYDKKLSVAVGASTEPAANGWLASYDYEAIGKAADIVFIMSYDQHYEGGSPGPVSGLPWVENVLDYITRYIPEEKIILGLPFYGRYWTEAVDGKGINYKNLYQLINTNQAHVKWDSYNQLPYSVFTNKDTNKVYQIWFDDKYSLGKKLSLVDKYGLLGWGAWRLGQEDLDFWQYIAQNSISQLADPSPLSAKFTDVYTHWAKKQIESADNKGLINGYEDTTFRPNQPISREEVAVLLSRVIDWDNFRKSLNVEVTFTDVQPSRWSYSFINKMAQSGLIKGYPDNQFRPMKNITRGELAAIITRSFDIKKNNHQSGLIDIQNHWAFDQINRLYTNGIIQGYGDGIYDPDKYVTRAEVTTILVRLIDNLSVY